MTIFSLSSLFCSLLITASVDNWLMIPFRSNENLWDSYLLLLLLSKCMNSSWCRIITVLMSSWRVFILLLISRTSDFFLVIIFFIFHFNFSSFSSNSWDFWMYSSSRSLSFVIISLLRSVYFCSILFLHFTIFLFEFIFLFHYIYFWLIVLTRLHLFII